MCRVTRPIMTKDAESTDDLNSDTSRIPNMPLSGKPPKISTKSEEEPKHTDKDSGRRTIDYTPHDSPIDSTSSWPRYTSTKHKQYIRISRQAWNIFLKYQVCLRPKTDKTIIIDFHDTWDALVQKNNNALHVTFVCTCNTTLCVCVCVCPCVCRYTHTQRHSDTAHAESNVSYVDDICINT